MAFNVYEMYHSRKVNIGFDKQNATLEFCGYGSDDDVEARAGFIAAVPLSFFGLLFQDMDINPVGGLFWQCTVRYDSAVTEKRDGLTDPAPTDTAPAGTDPLPPEYSFDISAVTEHITQSKQTISKTRAAFLLGVPPDNKKAIGITADGEVQGCDRLSPHLEWSTTRTFSFVTLDYINLIYQLVGKVNNNTFYGFPAGTCLFAGATMQGKDTEVVTVSFKFQCQPNEINIAITDDLIVPAKGGWEYLWVSYRNVVNATQLTQQPQDAYVERIYDSADFSLIGIGA